MGRGRSEAGGHRADGSSGSTSRDAGRPAETGRPPVAAGTGPGRTGACDGQPGLGPPPPGWGPQPAPNQPGSGQPWPYGQPGPSGPPGYGQPPTCQQPLRPSVSSPATAAGLGLGPPRFPSTSGKATTVMVLGIVSLVLMVSCGLGFIPAVIALVMAPGAGREIEASGGGCRGEPAEGRQDHRPGDARADRRWSPGLLIVVVIAAATRRRGGESLVHRPATDAGSRPERF